MRDLWNTFAFVEKFFIKNSLSLPRTSYILNIERHIYRNFLHRLWPFFDLRTKLKVTRAKLIWILRIFPFVTATVVVPIRWTPLEKKVPSNNFRRVGRRKCYSKLNQFIYHIFTCRNIFERKKKIRIVRSALKWVSSDRLSQSDNKVNVNTDYFPSLLVQLYSSLHVRVCERLIIVISERARIWEIFRPRYRSRDCTKRFTPLWSLIVHERVLLKDLETERQLSIIAREFSLC